jgi:tight adherence protein C
MLVYLIPALAITFTLGFLLVFLLLGSRSQERARLMEVTGAAVSAAAPRERGRLRTFLTADQLSEATKPLRKLFGSGQNTEVVRRLASAGYRKQAHADLFSTVKIALPALAGLAGVLLIKENVFFWVLFLAAVGYLLPDLWLMRAIAQRQDAIRLSLPDALDLLVICMEAGLGLDQALVRVGQELELSHPELSEEFLLINLEQRAGKPRLEAWRNMADRAGVESVRQFVQMLIQTERFGTPISKAMGQFADALRIRRRQQAEEMAAKTTIKLIPPLVFFIFPSLFIVLLGPAALTIMRNLGKAFSGE